MRARAGWLVLPVLWLHQIAIAFLSPLSDKDWAAAIDGPSSPTLGGLYHWVIVESRVAHVALTPLLVMALPLGLATLARGRRLRPAGDDALLVAVIASALWLTVPQFGLACSYRMVVATHVIGMAAAAWYIVGFRAVAARARAGAAISARVVVGLALAGVVAGATTQAVSAATILVCAAIAAGTRDPVTRRWAGATRRWAGAGLAGLIAGAALAWTEDVPALIEHITSPDLDADLHAFNVQMRVPDWIGAAGATAWILHTAWRRWRGRPPVVFADSELDAIRRGVALALVLALIGLGTADFTSFQVIAPGVAVAAVAALVVVHLAGAGRARLVIAGLAIAIQAKMITGSIRALGVAHREFGERVAVLSRAPRGTIAAVTPYPRHSRDWFFGEDFRLSFLRDRVATRVFGLRGIVLTPAQRDFQEVPQLMLHHEVDGDARGFPDFYSADLVTACDQFTAAVNHRPISASLIMDHAVVPDRPGVPVVVAWTGGDGRVTCWKIEQRRPDREGQLRLVPRGDDLGDDDRADGVVAMWSFDLATRVGQALSRGDDGVFRLRPGRRLSAGIVVCTAARCALAGVIGLY